MELEGRQLREIHEGWGRPVDAALAQQDVPAGVEPVERLVAVPCAQPREALLEKRLQFAVVGLGHGLGMLQQRTQGGRQEAWNYLEGVAIGRRGGAHLAGRRMAERRLHQGPERAGLKSGGQPTEVLAVGRNYAVHRHDRQGPAPPRAAHGQCGERPRSRDEWRR
ncbi:hypothetical protein [Phenylobacterium sp. J367]|uniref:hypothetical protein n=1 Tax=Phenylobacterium sp. J367 TaxID=2898435 RepID=UPI002151852D|nr:hypothetical protein [Phenylobacterium sp. J367]MCR5877914.1 hypothetical protein [Phenylobacterium sp. J367]